MTQVELAERTYLEASRESERALDSQGSLSAAMAVSRELATGHALLILKAEAGQCYRVGCRVQVEWECCAEHLTEVAS